MRIFRNFAYVSSYSHTKADNIEVDNIDIGKLKTVPADLSKLSNVVDNYVAKKAVYDQSVTKVNSVDLNKLVKKADYDTKVKN